MYEIFDKLVKLNNVSVYRVAKETGIPYSVLSEWKAGRTTPKKDSLMKIADYFNVSVDYLVGRDNEMELRIQFKSEEETTIYMEIMSSLEKLNMDQLKEANRYLKYIAGQN